MLTKPSARFLIKLVAVRRAIPPTTMVGRLRTPSMVAARDEAIALIYTHCRRMSLPELGRMFGGRDHTTILHSLRKMRQAGKAVYRVSPSINSIHSSSGGVSRFHLAEHNSQGADQIHEPRSTQEFH